MKVLISGESSIHLANYCNAIKQHIDELVLVTETPAKVETNKSYLVSFRSRNPFKFLNSLWQLQKIIVHEKPDLIHVHQINRLAFLLALCARRLNVPLIATAWGSDVLLMPQKSFFHRFAVKYTLKQSNFVTADALVMITEMQKIVASKTKYVWLQYGIDKLSLDVPKQNIIYSNRLLKPLYNIDVILNDFADFVKQYPNWKLIVGATGTALDSLKSQALSLGIEDKTVFAGWLNGEENNANYAQSKMYVSIPSSDGTSVSLLEAMSVDCVPIVSDLPVSREWITDGVNGIIRKKGSNPFVEALQLNNEKCFEINRKLIDKNALRTNTIKTFLKLYEQSL